MGFTSTVKASTITVTIDGTTSGTTSLTAGSIWGQNAPYSWPGGTAFEIVYTFDDTKGKQTSSFCSGALCLTNDQAVSGSSPGVQATLSLGGASPYSLGVSDDTATFIKRTITAAASAQIIFEYYAASGTYTNIKNVLYQATGATWPTTADWRYTISPALTSSSFNASSWNSFSIIVYGAMPLNVSGNLNVTSLTVSGLSCSAVPTLSLDTTDIASSGGQPNLLYNPSTTDTTSVGISATAGTDVILYGTYGSFSPQTVTTTGSPGFAASTYGPTTSSPEKESIYGLACGTTSISNPPIYNFHTYAYSTTPFNFHTSQVSNFTTIALTAAQIQAFLAKAYTSSDPSFLTNFYFDTSVKGGWWDNTGTGAGTETYTGAANQIAYCGQGGTVCPSSGHSGTLASTVIYNIANTQGINPEVVLTTLQKEQGLISKTTFTTSLDSTLDKAMGANAAASGACTTVNDFYDQLSCGTLDFYNSYNATTTTWNGNGGSPLSITPYPFFWPVQTNVYNTIQYPYTTGTVCTDGVLNPACVGASFALTNAATYAQYQYTPFVMTTYNTVTSGGVALFENLWAKFAANAASYGYTW